MSAAAVKTWHTPPECQGQIIQVSFGVDPDAERVYRRVWDHGDGSVELSYVEFDQIVGDELNFWCDAPEITGDWTPEDLLEGVFHDYSRATK